MPAWLPLLLGFLTAVGPISTDMYLPAFPAIEAELGVARGSVEITLASWFSASPSGSWCRGRWPIGSGGGCRRWSAGDLHCGVDRLRHRQRHGGAGRWRSVAAFGGAASAVIPRAMVRDLADGLGAGR